MPYVPAGISVVVPVVICLLLDSVAVTIVVSTIDA
jgi:hypothetical protein